ncbi:Outer membrane porin protein [Ralstonia flaminis]|jgi:predicted porin|uniref:Outer membrane porin protein n=2 Tax=Ralstonia flaminis TaxID=3058597 RepID=A0ABM9K3N2_9RALS|nr:Outer membrane porin protein [Ralstonia sp. LMG 18101]
MEYIITTSQIPAIVFFKDNDMKIKLFAAAAAALVSAGASAQSSVTMYGVADAGIEWANKVPNTAGTEGNSRVSMQSGNGAMTGSRWGLRGVEDLGGGLKGIFNLESGFDIGRGESQDSRLFGRAAYVGLQGQWGQVTLGRQTNLLYDFTTQYDPMALTSRYSIVSQDAAMGGRADNAIKYVGTFNGLTASALYSMRNDGQEIAGNNKVGREWSAGLNYAAGPFSVGAVYDQTNGNDVTTADIKTQRATLAGTYAFGPAKLFAGYRWGHVTGLPAAIAATASETRSNLYWLGAAYQATPALSLTGAAYYQNYKVTGAGNPWLFVVGSDYALSKRTDAYLNLAYAKNSSNALLPVGVASDTTPLFSAPDGTTSSGNQMGAMVGIRHKF